MSGGGALEVVGSSQVGGCVGELGECVMGVGGCVMGVGGCVLGVAECVKEDGKRMVSRGGCL